MNLDEFLTATEGRLPGAEELIGLCDLLGIRFVRVNGVPALRHGPGARNECLLLAALFRREPFRSRVIGLRLAGDAAGDPPGPGDARATTARDGRPPPHAPTPPDPYTANDAGILRGLRFAFRRPCGLCRAEPGLCRCGLEGERS